MKWFQGGIPDAVVTSQNNKAVFFVAIFGDDDASRQLEEELETDSVSAVVSSPNDFVCIRLQANSDSHRAFAQLFPGAISPSLYCIGPKAVAVDIIRPPVTNETLLQRLQSALVHHRQILSGTSASDIPVSNPEATVAVASSSQVQHAPAPLKKIDNQVSEPRSAPPASPVQEPPQKKSRDEEERDKTPENTEARDGEEPSFEEKVRRAKELALARQLQKQKEEEEEQRRREIERRQAGKGAAELKKWQEEEETKRMLEERRKDREAEKALRQKLREQIAQDRAARNARSNADFMEQQQSAPSSTVTQRPSVASASAMNYAGKARLSFRLPDGSSQTYTFEPDTTLGSVCQYLLDSGKLPFRNFTISIAFPRQKFESSQYSSTLRDLGLLPSAALLILPDTGSRGTAGVASYRGLWNLISALLGLVMLPISFVWSFAQRALPSPAPAPSTVSRLTSSGSRKENQGNRLGAKSEAQAGEQSVSSDKATASQDSGPSTSKGKNSASNKLDGNVHRLRTSETDSDEEKATWNGNSTQQM